MSIFDDELDQMKKVEVDVLIPTISKILNFISNWMEAYPESVCIDTNITSILKRSGYEVTYEELGDYATAEDTWRHFWGQLPYNPQQSINVNYNYSFMTMKYPNDLEYLSTTLKFSKVEIIIIDGYPYINPIGNNILLMKNYPDGGIPVFIKFFRRPTIVLMDDTSLDKIKGVRSDCRFVKYPEGYNLDNVIEKKVMPFGECHEIFLYQHDTDTAQGFPNDGGKFTLKTDYATTFQDIHSRPSNWIFSAF